MDPIKERLYAGRKTPKPNYFTYSHFFYFSFIYLFFPLSLWFSRNHCSLGFPFWYLTGGWAADGSGSDKLAPNA
jgi:hypothetical protein